MRSQCSGSLRRSFFLVFCSLAVIITGCQPPQPTTREQFTSHAAVTLGQVSIDTPSPPPSPRPSDGKCKNCKGVGKVGDGRTMLTCDVCKGTGKDIADAIPGALPEPMGASPGSQPEQIDLSQLVERFTDPVSSPPLAPDKGRGAGGEGLLPLERDPEANAVPTLPPTILVFTRPDCAPCKRWIQNESAQYTAKGWTIQERNAPNGFVPRFQVSDSKRQFTHTGYMTVSDFNTKYYSPQ
jgi:hypothetical protein